MSASQVSEIQTPTTYEVEVERSRVWLKEHQAEYLLAKSRAADAAERLERLMAFEDARKMVLDTPIPKTGEDALHRLGYLRSLFERATKASRTVLRYEAALELYKELQIAEKKAKIHGRNWFLPGP